MSGNTRASVAAQGTGGGTGSARGVCSQQVVQGHAQQRCHQQDLQAHQQRGREQCKHSAEDTATHLAALAASWQLMRAHELSSAQLVSAVSPLPPHAAQTPTDPHRPPSPSLPHVHALLPTPLTGREDITLLDAFSSLQASTMLVPARQGRGGGRGRGQRGGNAFQSMAVAGLQHGALVGSSLSLSAPAPSLTVSKAPGVTRLLALDRGPNLEAIAAGEGGALCILEPNVTAHLLGAILCQLLA